ENEQYVKTSSTENNIKGMSPCSSSPSSPPRSPLLSPPPPPSKVQKTSSPIIVEVYDDTPNSKVRPFSSSFPSATLSIGVNLSSLLLRVPLFIT
uniref:Uncharacterized protein n=1 Tax=Caenorhabditis japonica TaxID=281687 RepID=A0A8R1EC94_CAEJA